MMSIIITACTSHVGMLTLVTATNCRHYRKNLVDTRDMAVVTTRATATYVCPQCKRVGDGQWLGWHTFTHHKESVVGQFSAMSEFLYEISISAWPNVWVCGDPVRWSSISGDE